MTQATYNTATRSALADSTSHTGTISGSAAIGSVAVAFVLLYQAPGSEPTHANWTRIRNYYAYDASTFGCAVLVKNAVIAAPDLGVGQVFAHGAGSRQGYVIIVTVADGDLTKALAETARTFGAFGSAALPAVTTAHAEALILSVATDRNDTTHSTPAGYTKPSERITGTYNDALYHRQVPTATTIAQVAITPNSGRCQAVSVPIYGASSVEVHSGSTILSGGGAIENTGYASTAVHGNAMIGADIWTSVRGTAAINPPPVEPEPPEPPIPPTPPGPDLEGLRPYEPWPGCETHEWRSPAGETIRFLTEVGATGRFMPPVLLTVVPVPAGVGGRFVGAYHQSRIVALPVVVPGYITDREELRRWARVLDPMPGEGTLTVVDGPHAGRVLTCTYEAGLETLVEDNPNILKTVLLFRAASPYWQDGSESAVEIGQDSTLNHWFPFAGSWATHPLRLGASDVWGISTVTLETDVTAWPVVTVTGPVSDPIVRNDSTGLWWQYQGAVPDGGELVVDHRPGYKTARLDGANVFSDLVVGSSLWPLVPGPNRISIEGSSTGPETLIRFAWRNLWLAA